MKVRALAFSMLLAAVSNAVAGQPRVANGSVQVQPAAESLERELEKLAAGAAGPMWAGYAVPSANPGGQMCCWHDGVGMTCALEGTRTSAAAPSAGAPVRLESGDMFFVLYRVERGQVTRIRMFSEDCALDAGGRTIHWLTGVTARDSVAVLTRYATSGSRRIADAALAALAQHAEPTALDTLVSLARGAEQTHVRGQALFWLGQRAGQKAVGAITEALDKDPETAVKRQALFALSRLPKDEGVPRLIEVARTHANPAIRKQAMFWLGQSRDPRALAFFEEILFR
jgi:hypothetical protein